MVTENTMSKKEAKQLKSIENKKKREVRQKKSAANNNKQEIKQKKAGENLKKGYRALKTEIILSAGQEQKLIKAKGICRYVYNLFVLKNKEWYEKGECKFKNWKEFKKWMNNIYIKEEGNDTWIKDVNQAAVAKSLMNADAAYSRFMDGISDFPYLKKRGKRDSNVTLYKNNKTDFVVERHRIKVPMLGWLRLKEYGYFPMSDDIVITSGTISTVAGRHYLSILVKDPDNILKERRKAKKKIRNEKKGIVEEVIEPLGYGIGVDLGLKTFAVLSDGREFKTINKSVRVKKLEKKLKREQRSLSRKLEYRKKGIISEDSSWNNYAKNKLRVQKLHAKLANIRLEYVKSVSLELVISKPSYIVIEDLNIAGMLRNKHLSKTVSGQCFTKFVMWLIARCKEYGIELRQVSRWYASSKLCSSCGNKKEDLKLKDRIYSCSCCGLLLDRDLNAAYNLRDVLAYEV